MNSSPILHPFLMISSEIPPPFLGRSSHERVHSLTMNSSRIPRSFPAFSSDTPHPFIARSSSDSMFFFDDVFLANSSPSPRAFLHVSSAVHHITQHTHHDDVFSRFPRRFLAVEQLEAGISQLIYASTVLRSPLYRHFDELQLARKILSQLSKGRFCPNFQKVHTV